MLLTELVDVRTQQTPLSLRDVSDPIPGKGEILIKVSTCGVCHTELDEIEGRTPPPELPVILGHQVVGVVEQVGRVSQVKVGDRVGVAWIFSACGKCEHCKAGEENLCAQFRATGRDVDGGYAQYMTVPAAFAHPIPENLTDAEAAPLLCAGAIGYRSMRLANIHDGQSLGLTGFGGSNHLVLKMAKHMYPHTDIFVFTRNPEEQEFARSLGAAWAGGIEATAPQKLNAIIDTTPVWKPIVEALRNLDNGGRLVVNAIRKEEIDKDYLLELDYPSHLWMEKEIKSVANVTRQDVREFLSLAAEAGIRPEYQEYELEDANRALQELRQGKIRGAKVLRISEHPFSTW
ncbi:MAG: zinc-dependent alcohol dehydrogenase family protein [Anaerolineales bacterium]|nr:zinc-dependent alcohol dehydrogenase family protein [Anaerolineales bacterium]